MQGLAARKLELEGGDGLAATREIRLNSRGSKRVRRAARIDYKGGDVDIARAGQLSTVGSRSQQHAAQTISGRV